MAVKTSWSSGDVLTAADLTDTFAAKLDASAYTPGMALITPTSIAYSGGSASSSGGTTTFTGVSSISLNGAFSSAYDNYKVVMAYTASASTYLQTRFRASGADISTSVYASQHLNVDGTLVAGGRSTGQTSWPNLSYSPAALSIAVAEIYGPFLTQAKGATGTDRQGTGPALWLTSMACSSSTSADGFTFFPSSGTITGTIRVYGYEGA